MVYYHPLCPVAILICIWGKQNQVNNILALSHSESWSARHRRQDCGARIEFKRVHLGVFSMSRFALLHSPQIEYFAFYFQLLSYWFFLFNMGPRLTCLRKWYFLNSLRTHLKPLPDTKWESDHFSWQTDRQTLQQKHHRHLSWFTRGGGQGVKKQKCQSLEVPTDILDV